MASVCLVFPHQLYKVHPALVENKKVILVEEWLYFKQYNFHKQKLILHRASMQFYKEFLLQNGFEVEYINSIEEKADVRKLFPYLTQKNITEVHIADVVDNWLGKRLLEAAAEQNIKLIIYPSPNFLNDLKEGEAYFNNKKSYFQTDFYIHQRKKRNLLLTNDQKPEGGKWTFDADNRSKFPKNEIVPTIKFPKENNYVQEAKIYVEKNFSTNYGNENLVITNNKQNTFYPTTFQESEQWLKTFLHERFSKFGIYEDALVAKENILFHSVLTPMLNIGLLSPQQILNEAFLVIAQQQIPLNSLEGFVRQIVGWREFIRIVYELEGSKQRTKNYWGFTRKIPASFWKGTTGIAPIDIVIKKTLQTGYNHHIERLMVLGNFFLLCEFNPDEVYKWFMEMYVDAYDWVMVPNVYGMTQFADGGMMTTKPYISGSNYLMKMGDFEKGNWQNIWDGLFWRFMHVHRDFFLKNPRLGMLIRMFDKMPAEKRNQHIQNAEIFLNQLDAELSK